LILSAPNQHDIGFSLIANEKNEAINVRIWKDDCLAYSVSAALDQWFSEFLGQSCRLVYQPDRVIRQVDQDYAIASDKVNFSDGFPFMMISEASLSSLNSAMEVTVSMDRFRPNLVIAQCEAYAEDYWQSITIGTLGFRLPKPCSRCSVPAINPITAEKTKEPLTTLSRVRKWGGKVYFGQNALHNTTGVLSVRDKVIVNTTGNAQPPLENIR
jgi:uncharacterized protein YcbX